jgi:hypothetical protein
MLKQLSPLNLEPRRRGLQAVASEVPGSKAGGESSRAAALGLGGLAPPDGGGPREEEGRGIRGSEKEGLLPAALSSEEGSRGSFDASPGGLRLFLLARTSSNAAARTTTMPAMAVDAGQGTGTAGRSGE